MNKQTIIRAAVLAALSILAITLGFLCFGAARESNAVMDVDAPMKIAGEPDYTENVPISILKYKEDAHTEQQAGIGTESDAPDVAPSFGTLTIRGQVIPIADNVDESTLKQSPGWMPDSALPGENGMCVILGHRNRRHLRVLEKATPGDEIVFTYPDGRTTAYTISETIAYENTADWRLPSAAGNTLVLVTCWPFRYSGSAPGKYQVFSSFVSRSP